MLRLRMCVLKTAVSGMNELILRLCSFSVVAVAVGSALWLANAIQGHPLLSAHADKAQSVAVAQRHAAVGVQPAVLDVSKAVAEARVQEVRVELR